VNPEGNPPQEVVLSFTSHQGNYLRTLPLHASQEILEDSENEFRIRLKLCITYDFLMELLSYGDKLVVIKPESLAGQMKTEFTQALNRYM
jgi:predicted DNA-binding transcriptional regulator YafY